MTQPTGIIPVEIIQRLQFDDHSNPEHVIRIEDIIKNRLQRKKLDSLTENLDLDIGKARMILVAASGSKKLIIFTLPQTPFTIQHLFKQINVPFDNSTPIQCKFVSSSNLENIDYIATVGIPIPAPECKAEWFHNLEQSIHRDHSLVTVNEQLQQTRLLEQKQQLIKQERLIQKQLIEQQRLIQVQQQKLDKLNPIRHSQQGKQKEPVHHHGPKKKRFLVCKSRTSTPYGCETSKKGPAVQNSFQTKLNTNTSTAVRGLSRFTNITTRSASGIHITINGLRQLNKPMLECNSYDDFKLNLLTKPEADQNQSMDNLSTWIEETEIYVD